MQTASSVKAGFAASNDHVEESAWTAETSAEDFRKSIADGWVWLDFISISQTIGCTTEEEVQVALNEQIEAWDPSRIGDIARYLTRRAQRAEALALPLAGRYANLRLSPI